MTATVWKERQSVLIQDFQHEEILNIEANACFRGDQIPGVQVYWGQLCHGQVWQDIKGWLSPSALSWLTSWLTRCLQMRRRRSPPTWWVSTKQSRLWLRSKLILPELHLKSTYQASSRNGVSRTSSSLSRWLWKLNLKQTRLVDIDFTTGLQWGGPQNLEGCWPQGHHHGWGLQGKQQVLSWCESQWKFLRNLALMRTPQTLWDTHWLCSGRSFNIGYFYQFRSQLSTIFLPGMTTTWKSPAQRQWRESSCTVTHWPDMVIISESWERAEYGIGDDHP